MAKNLQIMLIKKENNKMVELKLGMKVKDNVTNAVETITAKAE